VAGYRLAEYQGNAIGVLDPKTEHMMEWKVPTPWSAPYDVVADRNGEAWTGSCSPTVWRASSISRVPSTPNTCCRVRPNIRRVYIDDSKRPGTLWIGSNHRASIVKVEPLD